MEDGGVGDCYSLLALEHGHLLLRPFYLRPYKTGGTTLSQVPTSQRLQLLQEFLPPQVTNVSVVLCTIAHNLWREASHNLKLKLAAAFFLSFVHTS